VGKKLPTIGIGASDLGASVRFYSEALGLNVGQEGAAQKGPVVLTDNRHVKLVLEPCQGGHKVSGPIATIANLGLVNLTFHAPTLDPVIASIEGVGGRVLRETRVDLGAGREGVFAADPDGVPIELVSGSDALAFIHVVSCVSELARSTPILTALGYAAVRDIDVARPLASVSKFVRLPGARLRGRVLRHKDGGEIELIEMLYPKAAGSPGTGPAAEDPGLRYIAVEVDDLDAVVMTLEVVGVKGERTVDSVTGRVAWSCMDFDRTRLRCIVSNDRAKSPGSSLPTRRHERAE
jgi:catechol 2,3-dioxygenase-like lactoylglutathione lyase family enzyme